MKLYYHWQIYQYANLIYSVFHMVHLDPGSTTDGAIMLISGIKMCLENAIMISTMHFALVPQLVTRCYTTDHKVIGYL